mmetsp:Transcript_5366/g.10361  ORF Transcript_5366/g.10361 Transcript_5366/m.10361 type:complete len:1057 (-) Transcript_5366:108-3278(-)
MKQNPSSLTLNDSIMEPFSSEGSLVESSESVSETTETWRQISSDTNIPHLPSSTSTNRYTGLENARGAFMEQRKRKEERSRLRRIFLSRVTRLGFAGGFVGGCFVLFLLSFPLHDLSSSCPGDTAGSCETPSDSWHPLRKTTSMAMNGIRAYLDLFIPFSSSQIERNITSSTRQRRLSDDKQKTHGPTLVIAGKMSVEDAPCNIAQYDFNEKEWSLTERIQLSLYNSYSGGEVYMLLANHTLSGDGTDSDEDGQKRLINPRQHSVPISRGSGELLVVGAFDTTYRNSQVTYCSVGMWDGDHLSKVGEGLCNSALSKGMKITTAALAGPQDVYVAGSFQTQVWNGDRHEFVKIYNIAHFNAKEQVWLPLNVGQITCSWCTVTVLALAWDSKRRQLHVAGKFNSIDGRNVPAGLAVYDYDSGRLVAHPGGGLTMQNVSQDGVGTALQLDEDSGVLYVMGSFERLSATYEICLGLAAYEIEANRWTCLADAAHTVQPSGGSNMLLTKYGLMVAGKTTSSTTWPYDDRPYTIALLKSTLKTRRHASNDDDAVTTQTYRNFNWSWLPGFDGHDDPLHALANGFGTYEGSVFIAGDNLVAQWSADSQGGYGSGDERRLATSSNQAKPVPTTTILSTGHVRGAIMAISQMMPDLGDDNQTSGGSINITIVVYCVAVGCVIGVIGAVLCNRNLSSAVFPFMGQEKDFKGFSLDTLTYSALENTNIMEAYHRAMETRYVQHPHLLTIIDPQEIFLQRIIGEGSFGRVWSARWRSASVAVKEFVFAQAAVAGRSSMQQEIVEEIIGEAGMMAILRHPNVLQLFGCSLTAQAIWIVSELCSLGSLRQLLDDKEFPLSMETRLSMALQVAEGMTYLHNQDPPIIHRDLKSHNIFVHETFIGAEDASVSSVKQKRGKDAHDHYEKLDTHSSIVAKIGDWGSARATLSGSRTMTHGVGTACWLAPEVIKHARSSKFSDVYGYGIILWELATRDEVYSGLETTQIIAKVANENLRPPIESVPDDCPWKDLMAECWAENPLERIEFSDIVARLNELQGTSISSRSSASVSKD